MSLIRDLSDEELDQFGKLAADQLRQEFRLVWLEVGLVLVALGALAWAVVSVARFGFDRMAVVACLGAMAALYWPWRQDRLRRVWRRHIGAVREERVRRGRP